MVAGDGDGDGDGEGDGGDPFEQTWSVEGIAPDGSAVAVRLALRPEERRAWYWAAFLRPGVGPVVVADHDVPFPRGRSLEIRSEALWAEFICETAGEHWSIGLEAFAVDLEDPDDAYSGEIGHRVALGFDLEWEVEAEFLASTPAGAAGLRGFGAVRGEVLLGRARIDFDGRGRFRHARHRADPWIDPPADGWVWLDGARPESGPDSGAGMSGTPARAPVLLPPVVPGVAPVRFARVATAVHDGDRSGIRWAEFPEPRRRSSTPRGAR